MLFVKLCRLSAKESRGKQKDKGNYEYKEGLASRNSIESVHISLTEKPEYVVKKMRYNSRKKRIAAGSGTSVVDVNRLLKQFEMMQQMTKQMSKGKMPAMFGGKKMKGGKKGFFGF